VLTTGVRALGLSRWGREQVGVEVVEKTGLESGCSSCVYQLVCPGP